MHGSLKGGGIIEAEGSYILSELDQGQPIAFASDRQQIGDGGQDPAMCGAGQGATETRSNEICPNILRVNNDDSTRF